MTPELAKNLPEAFGAAHGWTAPGQEPSANCNGSRGLVGAGGVLRSDHFGIGTEMVERAVPKSETTEPEDV